LYGADARTGMRTAWLYLANIVGSGAGSILSGFGPMDRLTLIGIAEFWVVAGLTCSMVLMFACTSRAPRRFVWRFTAPTR
jgi:spermidine synthase